MSRSDAARALLAPRRRRAFVPVSVLCWIAPPPAPWSGMGCGASMSPMVSRGRGWFVGRSRFLVSAVDRSDPFGIEMRWDRGRWPGRGWGSI